MVTNIEKIFFKLGESVLDNIFPIISYEYKDIYWIRYLWFFKIGYIITNPTYNVFYSCLFKKYTRTIGFKYKNKFYGILL